jgi:hypothetical protein
MIRILTCLAFCLLFGLLLTQLPATKKAEVQEAAPVVTSLGPMDWANWWVVAQPPVFPASVPWLAVASVESYEQKLLKKDVLAFMEYSLEKYEKEVTGYKCTLEKQERVKDKLRPVEVVQAEFQEAPFSVYMKWTKGAPLGVAAVMFVKGQNNDQIRAKPSIPFIPLQNRDPQGKEAKDTGRYTINDFGIKIGLARAIKAWTARKAEGKLFAEYEGVFAVPQLGGRLCYKIHRSRFAEPEDDGVMDVVLYFDTETLLQVGTILKNGDGELIATYFFRDIQLNPDYPANYFSDSLLYKK